MFRILGYSLPLYSFRESRFSVVSFQGMLEGQDLKERERSVNVLHGARSFKNPRRPQPNHLNACWLAKELQDGMQAAVINDITQKVLLV